MSHSGTAFLGAETRDVRVEVCCEWLFHHVGLRMSVELDGYLKPFRGRGDNLSAFRSKFSILCTSNGWDTDEKKAANVMLLIDGAAFTIAAFGR